LTTLALAAGAAAEAPQQAPSAFEITEASFGCIRDMTPVRGFFVGNLAGDLEATRAAAEANGGVPYPPGSVVQLVPGEAMVKLPAGTSPATKDWEFFELQPSPEGTAIRVRGFTEAVNQFGGNCLSCHIKAAPERDLICEQGHGCDPIPLTPTLIRAIQNTDPRCEPVELPEEQRAALQAFGAMMAAMRRPAAAAAD
jgi:hypothetical protein